jgi:hypothetical protein
MYTLINVLILLFGIACYMMLMINIQCKNNNKSPLNEKFDNTDNDIQSPAYSDFLKNKNYPNSNSVYDQKKDKASLDFQPRSVNNTQSSLNEQTEKDRVKNNIDFNLFNTLTFGDVVLYDNELKGRLGLDRCLDNKVGTCVPYGNVTGIAYYYPPQYNKFTLGDVISQELSEEEQNQPYLGKVSYPNLR